jgi:hypothetical protein
MNDQPQMIKNPLVIIYPSEDDSLNTIIVPRERDTHEHFGLLIYDLVRHTARAFKVSEDDVWEWVVKERRKPTTDIRRPS